MRRRMMAALLVSGVAGTLPAAAAATQVSIELRHTPLRVRPNDTPSLCPLIAVALAEHLWIGAGYELVQDYDAVLWNQPYLGHKPIVMSGLRAGVWYRGGAERDGLSWATGPLLTYAHPSFSLVRSPDGIEGRTAILDLGFDMSIGYVWRAFRLGVFATPAWSTGQVYSPAVDKEEGYGAFTYRFGVALAFVLGQGSVD